MKKTLFKQYEITSLRNCNYKVEISIKKLNWKKASRPHDFSEVCTNSTLQPFQVSSGDAANLNYGPSVTCDLSDWSYRLPSGDTGDEKYNIAVQYCSKVEASLKNELQNYTSNLLKSEQNAQIEEMHCTAGGQFVRK